MVPPTERRFVDLPMRGQVLECHKGNGVIAAQQRRLAHLRPDDRAVPVRQLDDQPRVGSHDGDCVGFIDGQGAEDCWNFSDSRASGV